MSRKLFIKGTLLLTVTGLLSRLIGFFYRIFLSHTIGAHGLGIFQLVLPLQMLVMSVCASGIQTAISRLTASETASEHSGRTGDYFAAGTAFSVGVSCLFAWFLYTYADFWAVRILREPQTAALIQLLSFSIPLSTFHACVNSYYFGKKQAGFPAGTQLLEQIFRVGGCYLLYLITISQGRTVTPLIAVGANLIGESAAAFLSLFTVSMHFRKTHYTQQCRSDHDPCQTADVRAQFQKCLKYLRCFHRNGPASDPVSGNHHELSCSNASAIYHRTSDSRISEADPVCDRADFPILSSAWRFLHDLFPVSGGFSWSFSVSQRDCRCLYPDNVLYLSFSVSEYNTDQCPERTRQIRHLPDAQHHQYLHPCKFCIICNPPVRYTWISVRNPL